MLVRAGYASLDLWVQVFRSVLPIRRLCGAHLTKTFFTIGGVQSLEGFVWTCLAVLRGCDVVLELLAVM